MPTLNTALVQLGAADASKTLVAAPSGGVTELEKAAIVVHRIVYASETAHANTITVAAGTVEYAKITNLAANGIFDTGFHKDGIKGQVETALIASQTAGPAGKFWVTYSVE
jgi:hypothetical protein